MNGTDRMISVCGAVCSECEKYPKECSGCETIEGKAFWLKYIGLERCDIYSCCKEKNLDHCGKCPDSPCKIYFSHKDPKYSDEEYRNMVENGIALLRSL
jgi:hypothetical protein